MSLAGIVAGAGAQAHVAKDDREAWLQAAWAGIQTLCASVSVTLPDARLSVGVPPTAARARKKATAEQITVAVWGDKKRGYEVHVLPSALRTKDFAISALWRAAQLVSGKTVAVDFKGLIAALPEPPDTIADTQHPDSVEWNGLVGTAKQSTRLLKAMCTSCGFVCRVANSQAKRGLPFCGTDACSAHSPVRLELKQ